MNRLKEKQHGDPDPDGSGTYFTVAGNHNIWYVSTETGATRIIDLLRVLLRVTDRHREEERTFVARPRLKVWFDRKGDYLEGPR